MEMIAGHPLACVALFSLTALLCAARSGLPRQCMARSSAPRRLGAEGMLRRTCGPGRCTRILPESLPGFIGRIAHTGV
jgi:hypothetical protein